MRADLFHIPQVLMNTTSGNAQPNFREEAGALAVIVPAFMAHL